MAVIKRDVVLMGKSSGGDTAINMPITRLGNIEDDAEIKAAPTTDDFIPIIDMADGGQMKKTPYVAPEGGGGSILKNAAAFYYDDIGDGNLKIVYLYDTDLSALSFIPVAIYNSSDTSFTVNGTSYKSYGKQKPDISVKTCTYKFAAKIYGTNADLKLFTYLKFDNGEPVIYSDLSFTVAPKLVIASNQAFMI